MECQSLYPNAKVAVINMFCREQLKAKPEHKGYDSIAIILDAPINSKLDMKSHQIK